MGHNALYKSFHYFQLFLRFMISNHNILLSIQKNKTKKIKYNYC